MEYKLLYKLSDRDTGEKVAIYGVNKEEGETFFLMYLDWKQEFGWVHSSYFEPVK